MTQYDGPALFDQNKLLELASQFMCEKSTLGSDISFTATTDEKIAAISLLTLILDCEKKQIDLELAFIKLVEDRI